MSAIFVCASTAQDKSLEVRVDNGPLWEGPVEEPHEIGDFLCP